MIAVLEQTVHHLMRSVVRIGDEIARVLDVQDAEQGQHFVEQGAPVTIGPNQTLVNTRGERHRENTLSCPHEQADGLQGCPIMYSGLVFDSDCWCKSLTAGIFLPRLPILMPSPTRTSRPLTRKGRGNKCNTACTHSAESRSSLRALL